MPEQGSDLTALRERIDVLDHEIARLLTERMEVTDAVAAFKAANNLPVYHPERERQVIEKVCALTKEEYRPAMEAIYQCIMDQSKKNQQKILENSQGK